MIDKADECGRYPLSYREYTAIRAMFGADNALIMNYAELEKRAKTVPGMWRDLRMLVTVMDKVLHELLTTIPTDRLISIKRELKSTICELKVNGPMVKIAEDCTYVPASALYQLVEGTTKWACFGCNRTHKDAKKNCPVYRAVQDCYHYEFEKCDTCPFSDTEA